VFDISNIAFNAIVVLIIIGMQNIWLSVVFFVRLVIFILIQYFLYKRNYPNEVEANVRDSKVSGVLSDTITNNYNIKTFASLHRESNYFDSVLLMWKSKNRKRWSRALVIRSST
jgi:ABC-type multidrug transport system fused ATPase/permease subunit